MKHTALGRFKHENAEMVQAKDGRVVVYMGDDERGEFMYKFVSNGTYTEGGSTEGLLSDGTLYVAKFNDDLTGEWLALTPETTGMSMERDSGLLAHRRFQSRRDHHGPSGMDRRQPAEMRSLLRADQQQESRREAERRWR